MTDFVRRDLLAILEVLHEWVLLSYSVDARLSSLGFRRDLLVLRLPPFSRFLLLVPRFVYDASLFTSSFDRTTRDPNSSLSLCKIAMLVFAPVLSVHLHLSEPEVQIRFFGRVTISLHILT